MGPIPFLTQKKSLELPLPKLNINYIAVTALHARIFRGYVKASIYAERYVLSRFVLR